MSRWFRMYDDLLDDPKVQRLDPVLFKTWVNLLCLASRNDGVLPAIEDIAFSLRVDESVAAARLAELSGKGLIDEIEGEQRPHNWDNRQFKTDNSTERSRKHREAKKERAAQQECNVAATVDETPPETEHSRTEQSRAEGARAEDPQHWQEVQGYLSKTDNLTDWEVEFLHSIKWAETLSKNQADSLKTIRGKLSSPQVTGAEVFVVKRDTPEFAAWIDYRRKQGLPTAFHGKQPTMTVPSIFPP